MAIKNVWNDYLKEKKKQFIYIVHHIPNWEVHFVNQNHVFHLVLVANGRNLIALRKNKVFSERILYIFYFSFLRL